MPTAHPLSTLGYWQARGLVAALDSIELRALFVGPSARCRQTLLALAAARGLRIDDHHPLLAAGAPTRSTARGAGGAGGAGGRRGRLLYPWKSSMPWRGLSEPVAFWNRTRQRRCPRSDGHWYATVAGCVVSGRV
ncbi:histidine phosphatase family protein [Rhodococcus sp. NPDC127530]|uniref:histidine phosphatase family protein n=1 Tax=unclassified Rhodococcus (in: high G+C Gram-positive bacteria) TaxID=192944 RepID=UPI0036263AA8